MRQVNKYSKKAILIFSTLHFLLYMDQFLFGQDFKFIHLNVQCTCTKELNTKFKYFLKLILPQSLFPL